MMISQQRVTRSVTKAHHDETSKSYNFNKNRDHRPFRNKIGVKDSDMKWKDEKYIKDKFFKNLTMNKKSSVIYYCIEKYHKTIFVQNDKLKTWEDRYENAKKKFDEDWVWDKTCKMKYLGEEEYCEEENPVKIFFNPKIQV